MKERPIPHESEAIDVDGIMFTHGDIYKVVDQFYTKIQEHGLLKVPFQSVHDWPEHIRRLTHFWWIRLGGDPYMAQPYNPVEKHYHAGFTRELLAHWLMLFHETLESLLTQKQADLWGEYANHMGQALASKDEYYRSMKDGQ